MAYELDKSTEFDYGKHVDALIKFIKEHWILRARPKGYDKFCEDYSDFKGMEELDEKKLMDSFEGHDAGGTTSFPFPMRISLPHVAYDDICQGREPIWILIGSIFAYGMLYGERYEQIYENSEMNSRITFIEHCIDFLRYREEGLIEEDLAESELRKQKLKELLDTKIDLHEILNKYQTLEHQLSKRRALNIIRDIRVCDKIVIPKNSYKRLGILWELLRDLCRGYLRSENPVFVELRNELKAQGIAIKRNMESTVFTLIKKRKKK